VLRKLDEVYLARTPGLAARPEALELAAGMCERLLDAARAWVASFAAPAPEAAPAPGARTMLRVTDSGELRPVA
jgi:hypothetical protein